MRLRSGLVHHFAQRLFGLACAMLLAACAAAPADRSPTPEGGWNTWLQAYRWRLESASDGGRQQLAERLPRGDRPLMLNFGPEGRIGLRGGCNQIGGNYRVTWGGELVVQQLISTRMGCPPALAEADAALLVLLGEPLQLRADGPTSPAPRLRLTSADQTVLVFVGQPTPQTLSGGTAQTVFLEVAPKRVACSRPQIPNARCLQVRERQYDSRGVAIGEPGPWQPLYSEIEGYAHAEGVRNVLRVKRFQRAGPVPADTSAQVLVLDLVVETEAPPP